MSRDHEPADGENWGLGLLVLVIALLSLLGKGAQACLPKETPAMPPTRSPLARILPPVPVMLLALAVGVLAGLMPACTALQRQEARSIVHLANGTCVLLEPVGVPPEGCVLLSELQPLIDQLLAQKRAAAARASASASASAAPAGSAR